MKFDTQKKISYYLVVGLVSLIIVGFLFTGYQGSPGGGQSGRSNSQIGSVEGIPIKIREYQNMLNQQLQMYSQFTGGKALTRKQIEQFGIKNRVIDGIINQKILAYLASDIGLQIANEELQSEIKKLPYFKTNEKFDLTKYKNLLRANRLSTQEFEEDIATSLKVQKTAQVINSIPVSQNYVQNVFDMKNSGLEINLLQFKKSDLKKFIKISNNEIQSFLKDDKNKKTIENLYNRNIADYTQEEQRKARHILIKIDGKTNEQSALKKINDIKKKITGKNFSQIAKKYSDDSSKTKGGDLGWFGKGKMVKPFEETAFGMQKGAISQPIKSQFGYHIIQLDDIKAQSITPITEVENKLAKKHLQNTQSDKKTNQLSEKIVNDLERALQANNLKAVEKVSKQYSLTFLKNTKVDNFNLKAGNIDIKASLYQSLQKQDFFKQDSANEVILAKKTGAFSAQDIDDKDDQLKSEQLSLTQGLARERNQKMIESLKKDADIKINRAIL